MATTINLCDFDETIFALSNTPYLFSLTVGTLLKDGLQNYEIIKKTLRVLKMIALTDDDEEKEKCSLDLFKMAVKIFFIEIIKPIITDLINIPKVGLQNSKDETLNDLKVEILSKWWSTYLSLLHEIYGIKKDEPKWKGSVKDWFPEEEVELLEKSRQIMLKLQYHWDINLLRTEMQYYGILRKEDPKEFHENYKKIRDYLFGRLETEYNRVKMSTEHSKTLKFTKKILKTLLNYIHEKNEEIDENTLKKSIISGRFDKKDFNGLSHTVVLGDDGGFYALLNSITKKEKMLLLESGDISEEYFNGLKQKAKSKEGTKIIIGQGTFGKIRLCIAVSTNLKSHIIKTGQIICVKKTSHINQILKHKPKYPVTFQDIRKNAWNDYSVDEIGNSIFSPSLYDMKIIELNSEIDEKHIKGYTMQQFFPVYDGSKIFNSGKKYFNSWMDQKSYLLSIYERLSKLLDQGICMTDIKPHNTLYDGKIKQGKLIDLSGVVTRKNKAELSRCKVKYINELTKEYTEPELYKTIEMGDFNKEHDLCKCMTYSLGLITKETFFPSEGGKESMTLINGDNIFFQDQFKKEEIIDLLNKMLHPNPKDRISVEESIMILKSIGKNDDGLNKTQHFKEFTTNLTKATEINLEKFGMNPKMKIINDNYIELMASHLDPEKYNNLLSQDLQKDLNDFISGHDSPQQAFERVFVLLGPSGSGKSTILQQKYLESLKNWEMNDPIPIFINLAIEDNLSSRWKWLNAQINMSIDFDVFPGITKYPMIVFIDSFDELAIKRNYITRFFEELDYNQKNKFVICCRTEFIQKEKNLFDWFDIVKGERKAQNFKTKYIVPLSTTNFSQNLEGYVKKYYQNKGDLNFSQKSAEIVQIIKGNNLNELMKTCYMVHLTLETLPDLMNCDKFGKINRRKIYEKYMIKQIEKLNGNFRNSLMQEFHLVDDNQFLRFLTKSAKLLAIFLYENKSSKVTLCKDDDLEGETENFLERFHYNQNNKLDHNVFLMNIIRALDLTCNVRDSIPNEQITLGFSHDTIKTYYLVLAFIDECRKCKEKKNLHYKLLSRCLLIDDELLIRFMVDAVKDESTFQENLLNVVFLSRNPVSKKQDKKNVIASANAITILNAANVSFASMDLSKIRINGANLRDGSFSESDFTGADLSNCVLENCKLDKAIFRNANLSKIKLGVHPEISLESAVLSCCFSPNGNNILAGGLNGFLKMWDREDNHLLRSFGIVCDHKSVILFHPSSYQFLASCNKTSIVSFDLGGNQIRRFEAHEKLVKCLAFSQDGNFFISGSMDQKIKRWDFKNGSVLSTYNGHAGSVNAIAFSPKGSYIISGSDDCTIIMWDIFGEDRVQTFTHHQGPVTCLTYSPDGTYILSGSADESVALLDIDRADQPKIYRDHLETVTSVAFSADGVIFLSGDRHSIIKLRAIFADEVLQTYKEHQDAITSLAFSQDGLFFVSSSSDKSIKKWIKIGEYQFNLSHTFTKHSKKVSCIAISPDSQLILSCSEDKTVKLWQADSGEMLNSFFEGHLDAVNTVAFSPDGLQIVSGSEDRLIKLWETATGNRLQTFEGHNEAVKKVIFSPDGKYILSASEDSTIKLWEKNNDLPIKIFIGHAGSVNSLAFAPDGKFFASGSNDRKIFLWDFSKGTILKTFNDHWKRVTCVSFSNDGLLCSGSADGTIKVWNISCGSFLKTLQDNEHLNQGTSVTSCSFSHNSSLIVSSFSDCTIKLWEKTTWNLLKNFVGHSAEVFNACFSPDELMILSASADKTLKFWDTYISSLLKQYQGHHGQIRCLTFSPDGNFFVSGSSDNKIKMWKSATGNLVKCFEGHTDLVKSVAFSPNGNLILSGSDDCKAYLWNIYSGNIEKTPLIQEESVNSVGFIPDKGSLFMATTSNIFLDDSILPTNAKDVIKFTVFSPCGTLLITGFSDKTIKLWSIKELQVLKVYKGHNKGVKCGCFPHKESTYFITGSKDRTIKMWSTYLSEEPLKSFEGHSKSVNSVAFSLNDELIVSGSSDKTIKIWGRASGVVIQTLEGHFMVICSIAISPVGNCFVSGSKDKTIKFWELSDLQTDSKKELLKEKTDIHFTCKWTISANETPFYCKDMLILDSQGCNMKVFTERGAKEIKH